MQTTQKNYHHFIDGSQVSGTSGRTQPIYNPSLGSVSGEVTLASKAEVNSAVSSAANALGTWSAMNPQRRARVLFNFKALVEANADELALLIAEEHGKVIADAHGDIQRGLDVIEFACGVPHLSKGEYTQGAGTRH
jgi:malonate-semialdehyde dehydrogenase (acetylating)/methylmalonate-semialdehyde dehydrogenase